jgi:hypothetical protein
MASATMQKVTKSLPKSVGGNWFELNAPPPTSAEWAQHTVADNADWVTTRVPDGWGGLYIFPGDPRLEGSRDGITGLHVNAAGIVDSIKPLTGEPVERVAPPALKTWVGPLLYPAFGFLLPWGSIRVLMWVVGFAVKPS